MTSELSIRHMVRSEVDELVAWAAAEGWNPGLHDAEVFWATDPEAFIAADLGDEPMIGGGAITSYDGVYGFMGFFIVRPAFRGHGYGDTLWHARLARLKRRLRPGASIGMDGVFDMQDYYAKGGFVFSHRNLRFRADIPEGVGRPSAPGGGGGKAAEASIVPLASVPFSELLEYDRRCFPAPRPTFLERWISQPDSFALGCVRDGDLRGYSVARRCGEGYKVGPLFADDRAVAEALFSGLEGAVPVGPLFLDAPESNPAAMDLVRERGMTEVFGCARMYVGAVPDIAHERVFGVTTFELG